MGLPQASDTCTRYRNSHVLWLRKLLHCHQLCRNLYPDSGYAAPVLGSFRDNTWYPQLLERPLINWSHCRLLRNPGQICGLQRLGSREVHLVGLQSVHTVMLAQVLMRQILKPQNFRFLDYMSDLRVLDLSLSRVLLVSPVSLSSCCPLQPLWILLSSGAWKIPIRLSPRCGS